MHYKMTKVNLSTLEIIGGSVLILTWFLHGHALGFLAMSSHFMIFSYLSHTLVIYIYTYICIYIVIIYIYVYIYVCIQVYV